MSSTSKKTFRQLSFPYFKEVYQLIDLVCNQYKIRFYLIGAQARDIQLLESAVKPTRGTMDIDFAVMFPDMDTYNEVRNELVTLGFEKVPEPFRMIYRKTNTVIDFLPFGQIEQNSTVKFTERDVEISVVGLKEVLSSVEEIEIENVTLKVTPLAGLFLLKLISWNDQPEYRSKDYEDIQFILKNYFTINQDRFYADHLDYLDEIDDKDFELLAGGRLLGRDMAPILKRSKELYTLIHKIIDIRLAGKVGRISKYADDLERVDRLIIEQMKKGTMEG